MFLLLGACDISDTAETFIGIDLLPDTSLTNIDSLIEPYLYQYNYLVTGIISNGEIVLTRSDGGNKLNTLEQYASVSKPVTATMTLIMYKNGQIDRLFDPIADYDERYLDVQPSNFDSPPISFFHLLTHTSGITHLERLWQNGQLNMSFSPGTDAEYSTKAYGVLGDVLETISGQSYQDLLTDLIETPIGGDSFWSYPLVQTTPGAGVFSTVEDMALFVRGTMNGTYYSKDFLRDTVLVPFAQTSSGSVGLGWFVLQHDDRYFGYHAGSNGKPRAFVLFDPKNENAVVLMGRTKKEDTPTDLHILALDLLMLISD